MVGDRETDVEFAGNIGVRPVRILNGPDDETAAVERVASFAEACETILSYQRSANVERKTTETSVSVKVRIDGTGLHEIRTGLGFFDHMLSLFVKHAAFDASVIVDGDLQVDEHHTVEDTGLVLGEAIRKALGEKKGIERYGFLLPMDEARSQVALDIGGRPFLRFDVSFTRERIGSVPTELFEDFFRAFSDGLRCNLHISADGRNEHHIIEACFKGVGRALRQAAKREERLLDVLPSTKGIL
jgi:imidazoleglycerol-phosphate dehydratase/histidinol-phosphatase